MNATCTHTGKQDTPGSCHGGIGLAGWPGSEPAPSQGAPGSSAPWTPLHPPILSCGVYSQHTEEPKFLMILSSVQIPFCRITKSKEMAYKEQRFIILVVFFNTFFNNNNLFSISSSLFLF